MGNVNLWNYGNLIDDSESSEGEGFRQANTSNNHIGIFSRKEVECLQYRVYFSNRGLILEFFFASTISHSITAQQEPQNALEDILSF